jgi:hypothetical protein
MTFHDFETKTASVELNCTSDVFNVNANVKFHVSLR